MSTTVAFALVVISIATVAIWIGSGWLEGASAKLSIHYSLPPVVQGGIIAAAGSSFPELASVIFAALAGSFELGVGAIIGSAIFNVLVIPALVVVVSDRPISTTRTVVHKETLYYMFAVVLLFLTFALALIYSPAGEMAGELTRNLVALPLVGYLLYLFLQWQDTADFTGHTGTPSIDPLREFGWLVAGLAVILVAVHQLVESVLVIGELTGTPDFFWGIIIVAAATSLPDALVSVQAADNERDVASIANVMGSNTFDLLVVIPIGVLLTGAATINFVITAPMMGVLGLSTVLVFVLLRTDLLLTKREAYVLLSAYGVFTVWVLLEALAIMQLLSG